MGFTKQIKEELLVASARHCCVCHRHQGLKIEVHHITPKEQGGEDTFENAIPLCFDCHADAGHYFAKHPKGIKLAPSELIKHKKRWFEIVRTNKIPVKSKNVIHTRFIIINDFSLIRGFLKRDLSNFPIENTLLFENNTLELTSRLVRNSDMRMDLIKNVLDIDSDQYLKKYPLSKNDQSDLGGYIYHYLKREPQADDVHNNCNSDPISNYLLQNGIEANRIAEIHTSLEGECGLETDMPRLAEFLHLRPFYFKSLLITNISSKYIKLKKLIAKGMNGVLYLQNEFQDEKSISLPEVLVAPNQSILIPTGAFLSDFNDFQFDEYSSNLIASPDGLYRNLNHGKMESQNEIEFIGENLFPTRIELELEASTVVHEIHEFNFENIYWINEDMGYGSCPHLFFKQVNGDLKYMGEIFDVAPQTTHTESFKIPKGIIGMMIAELEQETTILDYIKINNSFAKKSIRLTEGQVLEVQVKNGDRIEMKGYYITNSPYVKRMPLLKKHNLIANFIQEYKNQSDQIKERVNLKSVR